MSCVREGDEVFEIKSGDTSPSVLYQLDPAVTLVSATVTFSMRVRGGGPVVIDGAAASVHGDPEHDATVRYDWVPGDTDDVGSYEAEFEVTYADDTVETFPNSGYIVVVVWDDI